MNVSEAIENSSRHLEAAGIEEPRVESEFLVAAAMEWSRPALVLHRFQKIPAKTEETLNTWIAERVRRKPLGYVLGEQPFMDLVLNVSPAVLLPRPETELLVEQTLRVLNQFPRPTWIVDVGTGSGNVALCLAMHPRALRLTGIDVSQEALTIARSNAAKYRLESRCEWLHGDLLSPLHHLTEKPGMIVANLPYVRQDEIPGLAPELHWEPRTALDGGVDGLDLIFRLIKEAEGALASAGFLLLEIGSSQAAEITDYLQRRKQWNEIQLFKDLAGLPRIIQTQRKGG